MHIFLLKLHIGRMITAHEISRIMVAHPRLGACVGWLDNSTWQSICSICRFTQYFVLGGSLFILCHFILRQNRPSSSSSSSSNFLFHFLAPGFSLSSQPKSQQFLSVQDRHLSLRVSYSLRPMISNFSIQGLVWLYLVGQTLNPALNKCAAVRLLLWISLSGEKSSLPTGKSPLKENSLTDFFILEVSSIRYMNVLKFLLCYSRIYVKIYLQCLIFLYLLL